MMVGCSFFWRFVVGFLVFSVVGVVDLLPFLAGWGVCGGDVVPTM